MIPAVVKPIHSLWNEVIGFFFLCFAAIFGFRAVSYYRVYMRTPASEALGALSAVVLTVFFAFVMAAFGVSSFRKARRISRS